MASVTPLFKSGNVTDVNNYRPVSILPTVSKLAERVVCNQLMSYLVVTHDVLCPEQHGFRPAHSTESALLDAVSYISTSRDGGEPSLSSQPTHPRRLTASSMAGSWRSWAGTA